jgi:hypothetical protein
MKKIFILLAATMLLSGCAETLALLGPASSAIGGGNIVHSSISSAASYGIKKTTGKSPMQHALAYTEDKNPNKKKNRCIAFVKQTESEACYIAKKQIADVKKSASKKIKSIVSLSKFEIDENKMMQVKKDQLNLKVKTKKAIQYKSLESIFVESAMSKEQISHLRVSIKKSSKN